MKLIEENKEIAIFMGYDLENATRYNENFDLTVVWDNGTITPQYSKDLNSLVPVWNKLGKRDVRIAFRDLCEFKIGNIFGDGETTQQAAALATTKAIRELYE